MDVNEAIKTGRAVTPSKVWWLFYLSWVFIWWLIMLTTITFLIVVENPLCRIGQSLSRKGYNTIVEHRLFIKPCQLKSYLWSSRISMLRKKLKLGTAIRIIKLTLTLLSSQFSFLHSLFSRCCFWKSITFKCQLINYWLIISILLYTHVISFTIRLLQYNNT